MTSPIEDFAVGGIAPDLASKVQHTEYGGAAGLIQPELDPAGGDGHSLEATEVRGVMVRAGQTVARGIGGVGIDPGVIADPVTGRILTDDMHSDVEGDGGQFSDLLSEQKLIQP